MPTNAGFRPQEMQRRQFQQATASAIDQHATILKDVMAALSKQALDAKASREFVADMATRMDAFGHELVTMGEHLVYLQNRGPSTLWGRLRWVFTGRR